MYRDQAKKVEANLEACGGLSDSDHDRIGNPDWKFHCFLLGSTQATFKTLTTLKLSSIPTVIYTIYIYLYTAEKTGAEVPQKEGILPPLISLCFTMAAFRSTSIARSGLQNILKKRPDDVVFTTALRTPIARLGRGFKHQYPEELLAFVLKRTRERLEKKGVDINMIEDICTGTVLMELGGAKSGRLAALHAGMPIESAY